MSPFRKAGSMVFAPQRCKPMPAIVMITACYPCKDRVRKLKGRAFWRLHDNRLHDNRCHEVFDSWKIHIPKSVGNNADSSRWRHFQSRACQQNCIAGEPPACWILIPIGGGNMDEYLRHLFVSCANITRRYPQVQLTPSIEGSFLAISFHQEFTDTDLESTGLNPNGMVAFAMFCIMRNYHVTAWQQFQGRSGLTLWNLGCKHSRRQHDVTSHSQQPNILFLLRPHFFPILHFYNYNDISKSTISISNDHKQPESITMSLHCKFSICLHSIPLNHCYNGGNASLFQ